MKELMEDGAKIEEAIKVLEDAGLLNWEKDETGEDARATLTLTLREADLDDTEEQVVVLSTVRYDEGEGAEMGTDLTCYMNAETHAFKDVYYRTVYGDKRSVA